MIINKTEKVYEENRLNKTLDQIAFDLEQMKKYNEKFKEEIFSMQNEIYDDVFKEIRKDKTKNRAYCKRRV